jgi:hypothetical protein
LLFECCFNVVLLCSPTWPRDPVQRPHRAVRDVPIASDRLEFERVDEHDSVARIRLRVTLGENIIPYVNLLDESEHERGRLLARVWVYNVGDLVELGTDKSMSGADTK